jgi:uncharacterized protein with von Willebrand factor type A (vWA) domain
VTPPAGQRRDQAPLRVFARALSRDPAFAAVTLGRSLREAGLPVTPDRSATFAAAVPLVGATDREGLYWAARLAFVTARDQLAAFDAVFAAAGIQAVKIPPRAALDRRR